MKTRKLRGGNQTLDSEQQHSRTFTRRLVLRSVGIGAAVGGAGCIEFDPSTPDIDDEEFVVEVDDMDEDEDEEEEEYTEPPTDATTDPVPGSVREYESGIHDAVNEIRREHEVDQLSFNEEIADIARAHSEDMAEREYFSHYSPEGDGPGDRMSTFYPQSCRMVGENIASVAGSQTNAIDEQVDQIVSGWMNSPGHRENLLREAFDEQGIGVAIINDDRVIATQKFCSIH